MQEPRCHYQLDEVSISQDGLTKNRHVEQPQTHMGGWAIRTAGLQVDQSVTDQISAGQPP